MTDAELIAYAQGWLVGQERAYREGFGDGVDATLEHWTKCVRLAGRRSEQAGRRKAWRQRVIAQSAA